MTGLKIGNHKLEGRFASINKRSLKNENIEGKIYDLHLFGVMFAERRCLLNLQEGWGVAVDGKEVEKGYKAETQCSIRGSLLSSETRTMFARGGLVQKLVLFSWLSIASRSFHLAKSYETTRQQ